ncbi:hypothetical protein FNJ62_27425, partial [Streptomyces benahoarensis]
RMRSGYGEAERIAFGFTRRNGPHSFFVFSGRRRHTRFMSVSWARRCV